MAIKEVKLNRLDLGIADEQRDLNDGYFWYLENMEVGDQYKGLKQVPNIATTVNNRNIRSWLIRGSIIYGLGWDNPGTKDATIYSGTISGSAALSIASATNGTATSYDLITTIPRPFMEYFYDSVNSHEIIYYAVSGYIAKYNITTAGTTGNAITITGGGQMQGGCTWQGNMYGWISATNTVYKIVGTVASASVTSMITVPSDQKIVEIIPYGNYLAIVCTSAMAGSIGDATGFASKMYLWDGVTTTSFAEIVEIGYGRVVGADVLDGIIHAVMGFPNRRGFRIKTYNGSIFRTTATYTAKRNTASAVVSAIPSSGVKAYTGYLYFLAQITRPGQNNANLYDMVLFRYGRKDDTKQNALSVYKTMEVTPSGSYNDIINDFVITEYYNYQSVANSPDKLIVATILEAASTMREVYTTVSTGAAVYTSQAGVAETSLYTGGDESKEKYLKGVSAYFAPLPAGATVTLKYKKNEETTWTQICQASTDNALSYEAINIESTGTILPIFREIAFRVETLGGATLTGMKFKYEEEANAYS